MFWKKIASPIIGIVLTISILFGILSYMTRVCEREYSSYTYGDFFREDEAADVLIVGSSKVINAIYPMVLWRDYGIESFNYGCHGNLMPSTYWLVMNAITYKTPRLVLVDAYNIMSDYKYNIPQYVHNWADTFDLSAVKIKSFIDLNNDPIKDADIAKGLIDDSMKADTMEYLWDYGLYHSRWNELYENNFTRVTGAEKGAESRLGVYPTVHSQDDNSDINENAVGAVYLRRLINDCRDRNIQVLVTYLPKGGTDSSAHSEARLAERIADEEGAQFISFLDVDYINPAIDYYDDVHLNPLGAIKVTDHLGQYLIQNFGLEDKREDTVASSWGDDYARYLDYKQELFDINDNLTNALLLVSDRDFDAVLCIRDIEEVTRGVNTDLLTNMSCNIRELTDVYNESGEVYVTIESGNSCKIYSSLPEKWQRYIDSEQNEYRVRVIEINRNNDKCVDYID